MAGVCTIKSENPHIDGMKPFIEGILKILRNGYYHYENHKSYKVGQLMT